VDAGDPVELVVRGVAEDDVEVSLDWDWDWEDGVTGMDCDLSDGMSSDCDGTGAVVKPEDAGLGVAKDEGVASGADEAGGVGVAGGEDVVGGAGEGAIGVAGNWLTNGDVVGVDAG
jgi:hypothetical protein